MSSLALYGWRDLEMQIIAAASGPAAPALTAFGPTGNIKQLSFGIGDSVYIAGHIPHDIRIGSLMYPHVHWSTDGVDVNSIKWEVNWTAAKGYNQEAFPTETLVNLQEAASGVAWQHMITEDAIGINALEVDSLFLLELKRVSNGGTDNTDVVFGLFVDLHYEVQQYATPYRTPNFYKQ